MKFEEILSKLKEGLQVVNLDWNGMKDKHTQMTIKLQNSDEHSMNTEPYIVMAVSKDISPDDKPLWETKRFPWLPSSLDLFSERWEVSEWQSDFQGGKK